MEKGHINYLKLQEVLHLKNDLDEHCILNQSLSLIANKWTLLVLMALMQGTKRNSELQRQINGISPKMLTQTLKILVGYGMVTRKVYPEVPPRVEYDLTEFGKSTADPLVALLNWSMSWEDNLTKLYKQSL
ncbi:helix-turn-helix domain-containing protein [uncultured Chryseobacterium sp.]|uniref:winged helix-turn-helix transcriptional regulator n=1 Tax=uncultured Chryseobacterium sp. TaxID=259322 RepID=UPI0025F6BF52|nr:helix-turn-helix domain-containing protein [uncultured Chryseobacterium sp.]